MGARQIERIGELLERPPPVSSAKDRPALYTSVRPSTSRPRACSGEA